VFKDNAVAVQRLQTAQEQERQEAEAGKRTALAAMADKIETETGTALTDIRLRTTAMTATADATTKADGVMSQRCRRHLITQRDEACLRRGNGIGCR
jgi:hypothetical protein